MSPEISLYKLSKRRDYTVFLKYFFSSILKMIKISDETISLGRILMFEDRKKIFVAPGTHVHGYSVPSLPGLVYEHVISIHVQ